MMFDPTTKWDTVALKNLSLDRICCIIGAGYSSIAGLPLGENLLDIKHADVRSDAILQRFQAVYKDFQTWREKKPHKKAEQYLTELYTATLTPVPFEWALELIMAILGKPLYYENRMIRPSDCEAHIQFWRKIIGAFPEISVVTLNYDMLIERCLRHRAIRGWAGPGCYYGGIPRPQILKGKASQARVGEIEMAGSIPLFKLHGSVNWSLRFGYLELYQDVRPLFLLRHKPAIVPPIEEKRMPGWLQEIWQGASSALSNADLWLVCGCSLPVYDHAVRKLFQTSVSDNPKMIILIDPNSRSLQLTWQNIVPGIPIKCLPSLPECLGLIE